MTDTMKRKLHARVLARRHAPHQEFLLSDQDFRFAADCERMRVDRNGSVLSLLLIRLPREKSSEVDVGLMSRVLEGRLRATDTPGLLDDGRIGVLLPDTAPEGAWKVAADVSEVYPPGPERPECEVLIYPSQRRLRPSSEEEITEPVTAPPESAEGEAFFAKPNNWWKRAIDVGGAALGLLASAPIVLTAAAAVKLTSPGPAFFVQEREGYSGRRFNICKIRTMCSDAEQRQEELRDLSHQDGPAFKMRCDPRTTRLGKFLRWSSIDEMPQFWNVLKGEMSLVGPRPLPTRESQACEGWQRRRLCVKPGITCTWQVRGRGKVRFDDWVRMDLHYVAKQSVLQDARLVLATIPSLLFHRGIR